MPPRPTSRCYQAFRSHANAPVEAVWVTDDILGRAFQRYIDVSRAQRRTVSYAPGPLYHRKRFGRRQMTELNSLQSAASLPVWALPNAPDMMDWQWQPPRPELWSPWPPPSSSPQPPPPPPPTPSIPAPAPLPEAEAVLQHALRPGPNEVVIVDEPQPLNIWKHLHDQLHNIRTNHADSDQAYKANFQAFINDFDHALSERSLSGSAAADVYMVALRDTEIFERRFPASAKWLRLNLMSLLATGVKSARDANSDFIIPSPKFWDEYMLQIARQDPSMRSADLLVFAMTKLRARPGRKFYGIVFKTLDTFFAPWRGTELHGEPEYWNQSEIAQAIQLARMWAGRVSQVFQNVEALLTRGEVHEARLQFGIAKRCLARARRFTLKAVHLMSDDSEIAEKLAHALSTKNPRHYNMLYTQAQRLLGGPRHNWSRAHYNWLQVMARLPKIKTDQFMRLLDLFAPRGYAALSHTELCNLLLLHWESNGKIPPGGGARHVWDSRRVDDDRCVLAALALAINKTSPPEMSTVIFWELWNVLRLRTGPRTFMRQLSLLSEREALSSGFLKRLAWTSNDHRLALLIHDVFVKQSGKEMNFWWPPFWDKFASQLKRRWKYPLVDPIKLITKLLHPDPDLRPFKSSPLKAIARGNYHELLNKVEAQPQDAQLAFYGRHIPAQEKKMDTSKQIARLKEGLKLLSRSHQVSDRWVTDVVKHFTVVLANKQGHLTARDLATLTSVMMRTLDKGQCGSKERFKWYLGVIHRFLGEDACVQVGLILKRRRDANWLTWRRGLVRRVGIARQTSHFTQQLIEFQWPNHSLLKPMWENYLGRHKRKAWRNRKRDAPMRIRRAKLIASCRSEMGTRKAVKINATKFADTPSDLPRVEGVELTSPATKEVDPFSILLKQPRPEKFSQGFSY